MKEELTYSQKAESACYADVPLEKQTIAMLLEYFDAMSRLYQLIPIQRVFEIINQQNPENPVPEEGFIKLTELFLDYNDGKYQYCILSPKEIFDENAVSEPFERYLLHEAALILDDSYEELVRMQFGKSYYIPEKEELLHYADEDYYEDTPERAAVYDFFLHKMRLSQKDAEDVMHEFLAQLEMNSEISRIFWDLGRIGYELNEEQISELVPLMCALGENIRMPDHCGHTPKELHIAVTADMNTEEIAQQMEEARMTVQMFRRKALQKAGKIAPILKTPSKNGPCPCGSGKKYKRCCGKGK